MKLRDAVGLLRETTAVSHTYITIFINVKNNHTVWSTAGHVAWKTCQMGSNWSARSVSLWCDVMEKGLVSCGWWCTACCMAGLVRWGPRWTSAGSGLCCCWPRAACCMLGWAVVCPVHKASWPVSQVSCLLSWCSLAELPFDVLWTVTPFRMNCFSLVRWLLLYRSLLVSLLCHWLVGRADWRCFRKVVPFVRGHFLCLWK